MKAMERIPNLLNSLANLGISDKLFAAARTVHWKNTPNGSFFVVIENGPGNVEGWSYDDYAGAMDYYTSLWSSKAIYVCRSEGIYREASGNEYLTLGTAAQTIQLSMAVWIKSLDAKRVQKR